MWYGQEQDQNGSLRSTARYLDVIAHELTHGITQYTSNLVYQDQSGALNESFSDIFGVIVNNWCLHGADSDVAAWSWEIAPGWRPNGLPLRDLRNPQAGWAHPTTCGLPGHAADSGGVHTNSNIHNKAAYNVLTAVDAKGARVFRPRDVAVLYYLTLTPPAPHRHLCQGARGAAERGQDVLRPQRGAAAGKSGGDPVAYAAVGIH